MGVDRADDPSSEARRQAPEGRRARGAERDILRAVFRLPMERIAEGPAAEEHGVGLLLALGMGGDHRAHSPRALRRGARAGGTRGQPDDRDYRQPDREGRAKGGSTLDPSGYDAGKKVVGRKRHLLTDTIGMLLAVIVHPASVQDRDGAEPLLRKARRLFPFVERIIGDAGYQGPKMAAAVARTGRWKIEIVRRCDKHKFVVLPKRWIVERTIGWISRNRRLTRDFERHCRIAAAFVRMAMIRIMLRRLAAKPSA